MVDLVLEGWVQQMRDEIGRIPWRMDMLGDYRIFRFIQKVSLEDERVTSLLLYDGDGRLFPGATEDVCRRKPIKRVLNI